MDLDFWFETHLKNNVLIIKAFGDVHIEDLLKLNSIFSKKANNFNTGILFDFRATTININFENALYFNQYINILQLEYTKLIPIVHLVKEEHYQIFEFIEEIADKKGLAFKTCLDEQTAMKWLECFQ